MADGFDDEVTTVLERVTDAFFALDTDWEFTYVNEQAAELVERDAPSLVGTSVWEAFPESVDSVFHEEYQRAMETQEPTTFEAEFEPLDAYFEVRAFPSETGLSVYFKEISQRRERQQQLQRHRDELAALLDRAEVVQTVNRTIASVTAPEEISTRVCQILANTSFYDVAWIGDERDGELTLQTGAGASEDVLETLVEAARTEGSDVATALRRETVHVTQVRGDGDRPYDAALERIDHEASISLPLVHDDESFGVLSVSTSDAHGFGGMERDLLAGMAETIAYTMHAGEDQQRHRSVVRDVLDTAVDAGIVVVDREDRVAWSNERAGGLFGFEASAVVGSSHEDFVDHYLSVALAEPTSVTASRSTDESGPPPETLCLESDDSGQGQFVERRRTPIETGFYAGGYVELFYDVTEQRQQQHDLERLNHVNAVIRRINQQLVRAPDRETIHETICSELVATDQYEAAWFAEVDLGSDELELVAGSNIDTETVEPTSASDGDTIASRAIETGTVTVDSVRTPAQRSLLSGTDRSAETGSIAAIPVRYANSKYGVLCVYAHDESAFPEEIREVFDELGQTVGHAINAHLRKEGLLSDTATKVQFRINDFPPTAIDLSETSASGDLTFTFDDTIPTHGGDVLQYVTTHGISRESFDDIIDAISTVEHVRVLSSTDETTRYEIRQSNPPMVDTLTTHGGRVDSISIEDGDLLVVAELPDSADVRDVVDQVFEEYPTADLEAQRSVSSSSQTPIRFREDVRAGLTDRQRTTLEVAYYAGYFEWPRETTGEEVSDSLDVSQSTFSQHLRAGERKTFQLLFEETTNESDGGE